MGEEARRNLEEEMEKGNIWDILYEEIYHPISVTEKKLTVNKKNVHDKNVQHASHLTHRFVLFYFVLFSWYHLQYTYCNHGSQNVSQQINKVQGKMICAQQSD